MYNHQTDHGFHDCQGCMVVMVVSWYNFMDRDKDDSITLAI